MLTDGRTDGQKSMFFLYYIDILLKNDKFVLKIAKSGGTLGF